MDAILNSQITELKTFDKYDEVVAVFKDIKTKDVYDPPLAFEWNTWRTMAMLDGGNIRANLTFDDAGNPLSTAPGKTADIVCDYGSFIITVEVTMMTGNKQYDAEGEPVFEVVRAMGVDDSQEHFFAFYLDTKKRPLCPPKIVTVGLVNYSVIHPRELFRQAIQWGATCVIIAHNHPSGDATPSDDDIELTRQLAKAAELIGMPLDDHVVVGAENTPGPSFAAIRALHPEIFS